MLYNETGKILEKETVFYFYRDNEQGFIFIMLARKQGFTNNSINWKLDYCVTREY